MATLPQAIATLTALYEQLKGRVTEVETLDAAYRGEFKLHYASQDFRDYFAQRYEKFSDNWCGIVADAPHERLEITGIRLDGEDGGDDALWLDWLTNDADGLSDLALLDAVIAKRAYSLVWGNEDGDPVVTWEHPSQAVVGYDPETRARRAGAKVWRDGDTEFATLYLPDEVWKFQRPVVGADGRTESGIYVSGLGSAWMPRNGVEQVVPNPLGKVPLVEWANRPRLRGEPFSDIAGTLSMQHAINLLWAQLFAVSDEATLGQRLIIGAEMPVMPILNEDGEVIGERPIDLKKMRRDNIAWIEDPGAKAHQWEPAKLDVFTDIIEIGVGHIAAQTRTPAHYLLVGGTIANVPEGALKALETGLVKRTEEKTQHFGRPGRDTFELMALVRGETEKAAAVRRGRVLWRDVENRSDAQRADALSKKKQIGYPIRYLLELDGLPPQEIERVMGMIRDEQADPILANLLGKAQPQSPQDASNVDGGQPTV